MPLAIPVCLLLWLIVLRLHEIRIMLQLQPDFQKNKTQIWFQGDMVIQAPEQLAVTHF